MKTYLLSYLDLEIVTRSIHRQFILFTVIGGICFVIDISLLALFVGILSINILIATALSFVLATGVNYALSIKFIFKNGKHQKNKEVTYFFFVSIVSLFLTLGLMYCLSNILQVWYIYSKIITVMIISILTYSLKKKLVFLR